MSLGRFCLFGQHEQQENHCRVQFRCELLDPRNMKYHASNTHSRILNSDYKFIERLLQCIGDKYKREDGLENDRTRLLAVGVFWIRQNEFNDKLSMSPFPIPHLIYYIQKNALLLQTRITDHGSQHLISFGFVKNARRFTFYSFTLVFRQFQKILSRINFSYVV